METTQRERAEAVQRMQDFIESHLDVPIRLDQIADAAGYSPFHATRLFKEWVGLSPYDYLRARRLSAAALRLRDSKDGVLSVALDFAFQTNEGFTRAFQRRFGTTPGKYREHHPPLPLFMPRSARSVFLHGHQPENLNMMQETSSTVFVQLIHRPARKFVLKRGVQAAEYFGYCSEVGCDVWGELLSLKGALDEPMGLWLPRSLRSPGTSEYVMGVEMPADYDGPIPEGMETLSLPPQTYLLFQGQPYEDDKMGESIGANLRAIDAYRPEPTGWEWDPESAPRFQNAPLPERGYIEGRPVKSKRV